MAKFIGTPNEFYELFGDNLLTKAVEAYTEEYKEMMGYRCQHKGIDGDECSKVIHAAHNHQYKNSSRKQITEDILNPLRNKDGIVEIDIEEFLKKFYLAHKPLYKTIKVLCSTHHGKFDKGHKISKEKKETLYGMPKEKIEREGNYSIEYIPNENGIIETLKNSGKCYIHYQLVDGNIVTREWENKRGSITKDNLQKNVATKKFVKDYNKRIETIVVSSSENP